ncbi:MAG: hypothetical protein H0T42_08935 [Deltaproteobacteria bacterium]|nr:hypothetical protein [Deltaproteobacteria bacterium]
MKIFSIRNMLGLAAVYGASQYAKKHGGFRPAFEGLLAKVKDAANLKKDELIGRSHDASVGSTEQQSTGYESGSYTGGGYSSDLGGTRRS